MVRTIKKTFNTTVSVKEGASRSVLRGIIQYDTLNEVNIRLSDGSKAFDYTGYTNIIFKVLKADGTSYIDSEGENVIATSPVDGIITVNLTGQATAAAGLCQSVIEVYSGDGKMTTARFNYEVFEALGGDDGLETAAVDESENYYPVFQNLMADLSALEASIEEAEAKRVAAETARVALEIGYVARAEKAAETAEMWVRASQDIDEGDCATRAELEAVRDGAAPAGYGLGVMVQDGSDLVDFHNPTATGWFYVSSKTLNGLTSYNNGVAHVIVRSDKDWDIVYYTAVGGSYVAHLYCRGGVISDWEWVNPPMLVGVEYRTTERCEGKPVYVQRINVGTLPVSGSAHAYLTTKVTVAIRVVRDNLLVKNESETRGVYARLPLISASTGAVLAFGMVTSRLDGGDRPAINIYVTTDCSEYTCIAEVWYTKDTDT